MTSAETVAAFAKLRRIQVLFERAKRTSVGHSDLKELDKDFRHAMAELLTEFHVLSPSAFPLLHHAMMNPQLPEGDAIWED